MEKAPFVNVLQSLREAQLICSGLVRKWDIPEDCFCTESTVIFQPPPDRIHAFEMFENVGCRFVYLHKAKKAFVEFVKTCSDVPYRQPSKKNRNCPIMQHIEKLFARDLNPFVLIVDERSGRGNKACAEDVFMVAAGTYLASHRYGYLKVDV